MELIIAASFALQVLNLSLKLFFLLFKFVDHLEPLLCLLATLLNFNLILLEFGLVLF